MDTRLLILAGTFALFVFSALYLVIASVRASRKKRSAAVAARALASVPVHPVPAPEASTTAIAEETPSAREEMVSPFPATAAGVSAVLETPLKIGAWHPDAREPKPVRLVDDYYDLLVDDPALLIEAPATRAVATPPGPVSAAEAVQPLSATPEPVIVEPEVFDSVALAESAISSAPEPVHAVHATSVPAPSPGELGPEPQLLQPSAAQFTVPRPPHAPEAVVPVAESINAPASVPGRRPEIPERVLVAPVEMWFGDARVGVRAGTKTYDSFQRIAALLFEDLKHARGGAGST
jgi:hypothetical protein